MILIGLTGNIACGKSLVSSMLKNLGAEVIDADRIVHELMVPEAEVWRRIVGEFGTEMLTPDGQIDRRKLGDVVFANPEDMLRLERIIHPAVFLRLDEEIAKSNAQVVVIEAIKLIEGGIAERCDSVWVVTCPYDQQVTRLVKGRRLTEREARVRIEAQAPPEEKLRHADVVIDNSGTPEDTWKQVQESWQRLVD